MGVIKPERLGKFLNTSTLSTHMNHNNFGFIHQATNGENKINQ